jgi:hypothetical protein
VAAEDRFSSIMQALFEGRIAASRSNWSSAMMSPYDILGVPQDADEATVRAAYRRLAKQYHPDRNPGNANAAAKMANVNAAYELLKRRSRLSIEGGHVTARDFEISLVVAIAGGGKTRALAKWLAGETVAHVVVAAPTIALVNEVAEWFRSFNCTVPVSVIHSDQGGDRSVSARIRQWFDGQEKNSDTRGGILACTHAAALDLYPTAVARRFALVFDEVPECSTFTTRNLGRGHWWISRHIVAAPFRGAVLRLQTKDMRGPAYDALARIVTNAPFDEVDALFQQLAAAIIDPHHWVLVLEHQWADLIRPGSPRLYGGELCVLTVLHPERFELWKSVTVMGARAHRSILHLLWTKLFGQRFAHHPVLQHGLPSRHSNGDRLTLRYFWQERATRTMLGATAKGGGTMQAAMCRSVAEHFGDRPFLWSLPQPRDPGGVRDNFWRGGGTAFDPRLRLPGRSFGQNRWRDHANLALLSVINLSLDQTRLIKSLGIDEEELFDAMGVTIAYQDLLRSNLRDAAGTVPIECIVPDLPLALLVAEELPGCAIEQMPERMIPVQVGRRGPAPSGTAMPPAERKRRSRAMQRQRREQERQRAREDA